jgi:hypothetical protein
VNRIEIKGKIYKIFVADAANPTSFESQGSRVDIRTSLVPFRAGRRLVC